MPGSAEIEDEPERLGDAPFQVQMHITCLDCGGSANDEDHAGPYLYHAVVEFDKDRFMDDPLDLGYMEFTPDVFSQVPWVEDDQGNEMPDHPVLLALKGATEQEAEGFWIKAGRRCESCNFCEHGPCANPCPCLRRDRASVKAIIGRMPP